jgi:hypothetical protein
MGPVAMVQMLAMIDEIKVEHVHIRQDAGDEPHPKIEMVHPLVFTAYPSEKGLCQAIAGGKMRNEHIIHP